jgi:hypothetical protein
MVLFSVILSAAALADLSDPALTIEVANDAGQVT